MVLEMVLLVLIAAGVFVYVLSPLVRGNRSADPIETLHEDEAVEQREPAVADSRTVHDSP